MNRARYYFAFLLLLYLFSYIDSNIQFRAAHTLKVVYRGLGKNYNNNRIVFLSINVQLPPSDGDIISTFIVPER